MLRSALMLALMAVPTFATAQDRDGNNTPGDWIVTHYENYGIWVSSCDERDESGTLHQRCYMRYVDVFSPRPKFAAIFLFVTNEEDGPQVDFGLEKGTLFSPGNFRLDRGGETVWSTYRPGCLTGFSCTFSGEDAATLLTEMKAGGAMRFEFNDRHGKAQDITWPLDGFSGGFADFQAQSRERGLIQ